MHKDFVNRVEERRISLIIFPRPQFFWGTLTQSPQQETCPHHVVQNIIWNFFPSGKFKQLGKEQEIYGKGLFGTFLWRCKNLLLGYSGDTMVVCFVRSENLWKVPCCQFFQRACWCYLSPCSFFWKRNLLSIAIIKRTGLLYSVKPYGHGMGGIDVLYVKKQGICPQSFVFLVWLWIWDQGINWGFGLSRLSGLGYRVCEFSVWDWCQVSKHVHSLSLMIKLISHPSFISTFQISAFWIGKLGLGFHD